MLQHRAGSRSDQLANMFESHKLDSNFYPAASSPFEVFLNLPDQLTSVFVADITKCFEKIPVQDVPNSLQTAICWLFNLAFRGRHAATLLYVWWSYKSGKASSPKWTKAQPPNKRSDDGVWFGFSKDRIISLSIWLATHAYTQCGDRVWLQIIGIAMGFACSPVWCNVYLLMYEFQFVDRLAKLERFDLLSLFKYWFRYIDDLSLFNGPPFQWFFNPLTPRTDTNPYWIYPLDIVSMKVEITTYFPQYYTSDIYLNFVDSWHGQTLTIGRAAHYLNFHIHIDTPGEPNGYTITRYVKKRDLKFSTITYLMYRSNRPVSTLYGTAVSQLVPFLYAHSSAVDVSTELTSLVDTLKSKGFNPKVLIDKLNTQLVNGSFPGLKFCVTDVAIVSTHRKYGRPLHC